MERVSRMWYNGATILGKVGCPVITALMVVEVAVAIATMAAILLQTGYSAGISGAFGGASPQQMTGGKKRGVDEFLERVTVGLAVVLAVVTLVLVRLW